jgi:hypothetical protein
MRSKIDNEVRPSTVKTWLTIWRHVLTQPTDHWLRVVAENRMRTPYATNILARINSMFYPTRPRREMQSYPRPRSLRSLFPLSRAPPKIIRLTFTHQLLTGYSVEIDRPLAHLALIQFGRPGEIPRSRPIIFSPTQIPTPAPSTRLEHTSPESWGEHRQGHGQRGPGRRPAHLERGCP